MNLAMIGNASWLGFERGTRAKYPRKTQICQLSPINGLDASKIGHVLPNYSAPLNFLFSGSNYAELFLFFAVWSTQDSV